MEQTKTSKRKKPRIRIRPFLYLLAFAVLIGGAVEVIKKYTVYVQIEKEIAKTQEEIHSLHKKNASLKKDLHALYDLRKVERIARERLGLTRPREVPVKVLNASPGGQEEPTERQPVPNSNTIQLQIHHLIQRFF
ncbi:MAG: septum formation initiator family protein [Armatimonadetes bacterium]|nr:septum formation initiator family protein [Armatimonadota bacterium]